MQIFIKLPSSVLHATHEARRTLHENGTLIEAYRTLIEARRTLHAKRAARLD